MNWMRASLCLVLALAAHGAHAENASLAGAKAKLDNLQYADAAKLLAAARGEPNTPRAELLEILQLQGATSATLGHPDEGEHHFRELLALDPSAKLDSQWGPKVKTLFFSAKAWLDDQPPMGLARQPPVLADGQVTAVKIQVAGDPLKLLKAVRVHWVGVAATPPTQPAAPATTLTFATAPSPSISYWAEALGEHGEVMLELGTQAAPLTEKVDAPVAAAPPASPASKPDLAAAVTQPAPTASSGVPFKTIGYVVGGVGVAALITGAIFALKLSSDRSQLEHPQTDSDGRIVGLTQVQATALAKSSETDALLSNVFLVSGGVLTAGGATLWVVGTVNTPAQGSGGEVGLGGRF